MIFGSLFAGIGGLDLGLERAGMRCAWQVEIDPFCRKVLEKPWPDVARYGDVRNCGRHNLKPVDLICGGFPCQDVSIAGRREGLAGERSGLWFEFYRVLKELKPRWVVIENVPGLLSSNGGRDFATILRGLAQLRYGVCWRILDAQYFGVAQRRRRVFVVGHFGDGRAAKVLFESASGAWDSPPGRQAQAPVAALTKSGVGTCGADDNQAQAGHLIATARMTAFGEYVDDGTASTLKKRDCKDATDLIAFDWQSGGDMGTGGNQVPLVGVRRLTPTECERLQGFPDGWTAGQSDSARYRQLGNAVAVPVAEWIGRQIVSIAKTEG